MLTLHLTTQPHNHLPPLFKALISHRLIPCLKKNPREAPEVLITQTKKRKLTSPVTDAAKRKSSSFKINSIKIPFGIEKPLKSLPSS